ncbi:MAG: hypothetical protein IIB67_12780, partial [Proteobacteria bacterium]|nr:hypothetical protein [Pseudomonadota bacterium]
MRPTFAAVFLVMLWLSSASHAAPICVKTIEGSQRLLSGIATAALEDTVHVELCSGGWSRLTLAQGEIQLTDTTRIAPAFPAADRLPDGEVTGGRGPIAAAWLTGPTKRYDHGILGDGIEASGLRVTLRNGASIAFNLEGQDVFEDLRVRLVDLDGDGVDELISIRSDGV